MAKKYNPAQAAVRYEYSKLSSEIRRNYNRLAKKAPNARILSTVDLMEYEGLKKRKELGLKSDTKTLKKLISSMKNMKEKKTFSVIAQKRAIPSAIQTMHNQGHTWINEENVKEVFAFFDKLRALGIASSYSSDYLISVYENIQRKDLTEDELQRNFDRWQRNIQKGKVKKLSLRHYQ